MNGFWRFGVLVFWVIGFRCFYCSLFWNIWFININFLDYIRNLSNFIWIFCLFFVGERIMTVGFWFLLVCRFFIDFSFSFYIIWFCLYGFVWFCLMVWDEARIFVILLFCWSFFFSLLSGIRIDWIFSI